MDEETVRAEGPRLKGGLSGASRISPKCSCYSLTLKVDSSHPVKTARDGASGLVSPCRLTHSSILDCHVIPSNRPT